MSNRVYFGIKVEDWRDFPVKDALICELAVHLFCNMNIGWERAEYILHESCYLNTEGFLMLLQKVKNDYKAQPCFEEVLIGTDYYHRLVGKCTGWFETIGNPNEQEMLRAEEILGLPSGALLIVTSHNETFLSQPRTSTIGDVIYSVELESSDGDNSTFDAQEFIKKFKEFRLELEQLLLSMTRHVDKYKVPVQPNQYPKIKGDSVYLGIDFSHYPHVNPEYRQLLAQNLFLSDSVDPFDAKNVILPNPKLSNAMGSMISTFDCSIGMEMGAVTVMNGIAFSHFVEMMDDTNDDRDWDDEDDDDEDDEWVAGLNNDDTADADEQYYLSNGFEMLYWILIKLEAWNELFTLPKEEHLRDTLRKNGINLGDLVAMRYTGLPRSCQILNGYSIASEELKQFFTSHTKQMEPFTDVFLDEYRRLKGLETERVKANTIQ